MRRCVLGCTFHCSLKRQSSLFVYFLGTLDGLSSKLLKYLIFQQAKRLLFMCDAEKQGCYISASSTL